MLSEEEKKLENLIDGNPEDFFRECENKGIDLQEMNKDIARSMVGDKFNIDQSKFDAVDFIFWMSYLIERDVEDLIIKPEVGVGARSVALQAIVNKLHFGDKIKIVEELHLDKKNKLIKLMRAVQNLRNDVAHGRFSELKYREYELHDNKGKIKLIFDYKNALQRK